MKTLHHHSHLAPEEIQNIKNTIEFCRANTMRRTSVLGYAQINCPLAYAEYFEKRNPFKSLHEYFNMIWGYETKYYYDLKECFNYREEQLIRENKKLPQKYDNVK